MDIETYEVTEVCEKGSTENFEQTKEIINDLDLKGQMKFVDNETQEVHPYRKLTGQEKLVYETLLPEVTLLKDYDDSIIPLRVLQVAAHALSLGVITEIEVWHTSNADVKDPLLVGTNGKGKYSSDTAYYILARWGDVLENFQVLSENARKMLVDEANAKITTVISQVTALKESIAENVKDKFNKGQKVSISFYV